MGEKLLPGFVGLVRSVGNSPLLGAVLGTFDGNLISHPTTDGISRSGRTPEGLIDRCSIVDGALVKVGV
jgi:hypothetical protein